MACVPGYEQSRRSFVICVASAALNVVQDDVAVSLQTVLPSTRGSHGGPLTTTFGPDRRIGCPLVEFIHSLPLTRTGRGRRDAMEDMRQKTRTRQTRHMDRDGGAAAVEVGVVVVVIVVVVVVVMVVVVCVCVVVVVVVVVCACRRLRGFERT